jgi:transposase
MVLLDQRMTLSEGQRADVRFAASLLLGLKPQLVIADRSYDFEPPLLSLNGQVGAKAVIPPKRNRRLQRLIECKLYRLNNVIERYIDKLKGFRRTATRYHKTNSSYLGFLYLPATILNKKTTVNTTWLTKNANVQNRPA